MNNKDKRIYIVATFENLEVDKNEAQQKCLDIIDNATIIGYYLNFEDAKKVIETNNGNIHEECSNYAIIFAPKVGQYKDSKYYFYKFNELNNNYTQIEQPKRIDICLTFEAYLDSCI